MKKIMLFVVTAVLLVSPFAAAISTMTSTTVVQSQKNALPTNSNFTHTVFIEAGDLTWCPYCPGAGKALYSMYNSSDYPFYYVAFVYNQAKLNKNRMWGHYRVKAYPNIFLDGGFSQIVGGATTQQQFEQLYRPLIEEAGARVVHPLAVTTNVTGHGNAKMDITVTVKNTGSTPYLGYVRSYVTEIISRWIDRSGNPFQFGFLDYAIKNVVFLQPQKSQTFTMTWNGAAQHGNLTFPDIVDNNIMVITAVAHWQPHLVAAQISEFNEHFAFYVDQTVGAKVE
jgi:glutaredoxin